MIQPSGDPASAVGLPATGLEASELLSSLGTLSATDEDGNIRRSRAGLPGFDKLVGLALAQIGVAPDDPNLGDRLYQVESDVVRMIGSQLGGPNASGTMTQGLGHAAELVCLSAREHARAELNIENPTMVCADTCHPAFAAAAHRAGLEQVIVPTNEHHRIDIDMVGAVVDDSCALVVVSVPSPFFGVVDPVVPVARLAQEAGALCHVDAGLGGWVLPFLPSGDSDEPVPFDLRVPGVTSLAVDLEQYAYAAPGSSVLLYNDGRLAGRQYYLHDAGPGPAQQFPAAASTLDPFSVLVAWLVLRRLGVEGYRQRIRELADAVRDMRSSLARLDGIRATGDVGLPLVVLESGEIDLGWVANELRGQGWSVEAYSGALRLQIWPGQLDVVDRFVDDISKAITAAPAQVTRVDLNR